MTGIIQIEDLGGRTRCMARRDTETPMTVWATNRWFHDGWDAGLHKLIELVTFQS